MSSGPLVVVEVSRRLDAPSHGPLVDVGPCSALELQLRRLAPLTTVAGATVVVATTELPREDPVVEVAERAGASVVRGRDGDLVGWLTVAHARHGGEELVRITNDAPLSDPFLVLAALRLHQEAEAHHTSNLLPRTHPRGLEVEVLSRRGLAAIDLEATDPVERRAVSRWLVQRPERFRLANLESGTDAALEDWSPRTPASLDRLRTVIGLVGDPFDTSWNRILAVAGRGRRILPGELRLVPGPSPMPGSAPWARTWSAVADGLAVGTASVVVSDGTIRRQVGVTDERWRQPTLEALYELLLDDLQASI